MMDMGRRPPLPLAIPALSYLAFEGWLFFTAPGLPRALRFTMVSILIFGVVRGNRIAVPLWMLGNLFGALMCCIWFFRASQTSPTTSLIYAALAVAALCNVGYLFFGRSLRDFMVPEAR